MEIQRDSEKQKFKSRELAQLSMIQIITLHAISKCSNPIIRHSLLQDINKHLRSKDTEILSPEQAFSESLQNIPKALISPSSFYTSLEVLERKGLVLFIRNKKGKVKTVEKTQLTDAFLDFIHNYFLFNIINESEFCSELFQKISSIMEKQEINKGNLFFIIPFDEPSEKFFKYIVRNFKNIYILGTEKLKGTFSANVKPIFSKIKNGQIREPNNDFDISLIQGFNQNFNFYNISFEKLLEELTRITKPNGVICVFARNELTLPNSTSIPNLLLRNIFSLYNKSLSLEGKIQTKGDLKNSLLKANLKNVQIIEDEGFLFGLGNVP